MTRIISIDPGKSKCGLVAADPKDKVIAFAGVIKSSSLLINLKEYVFKFSTK